MYRVCIGNGAFWWNEFGIWSQSLQRAIAQSTIDGRTCKDFVEKISQVNQNDYLGRWLSTWLQGKSHKLRKKGFYHEFRNS
jgi:hypothetical protein